MMRFEGKVALVTGGGSGIGRATALALAAEGAAVHLVGRNEPPLAAVARRVEDSGGAAAFSPAELGDDAAVRAAVAAAVARFGALDVVVNAAGWAPAWAPVHETDEASWLRALDVNLTGPFRVARAALPHLLERRGAIVNVASISALRARHSVASYAAAKAGLIALTRCIAAEYGWQGVRCNCVFPSWVDTPMTRPFLRDDRARAEVEARHALQRVATPDEIARAILFLASDEASFLTGGAHPVDGGMSAL